MKKIALLFFIASASAVAGTTINRVVTQTTVTVEVVTIETVETRPMYFPEYSCRSSDRIGDVFERAIRAGASYERAERIGFKVAQG